MNPKIEAGKHKSPKWHQICMVSVSVQEDTENSEVPDRLEKGKLQSSQ